MKQEDIIKRQHELVDRLAKATTWVDMKKVIDQIDLNNTVLLGNQAVKEYKGM